MEGEDGREEVSEKKGREKRRKRGNQMEKGKMRKGGRDERLSRGRNI